MHPVRQKTVTVRPNKKWFNANLRQARTVKRRLQRKYNKSKLEKDRNALHEQKKYYNFLLNEAKSRFNTSVVSEAKDNIKHLFSVTKNILNWNSESILPNDRKISQLPADFADFFVDKIAKINVKIASEQGQSIKSYVEELVLNSNSTLSEFSPASEDEIKRIILSLSPATCCLDPLPTHLVKLYAESLLPAITKIVNISLNEGVVPESLKIAVVTPLLKKANLNPNVLKNYRPVSNLSFLSKIIEKVVASRINKFLDDNNLRDPTQSAYRRFYSTETVLLRLHNDICSAADNKKMTVLVLLDLSAAFDTLNHKTLLHRLRYRFGITGFAIKWITSYLSDRSQYVKIGNFRSHTTKLTTGVPQGSILGPILFTLYMSPVSEIPKRHGLSSLLYADDTQLYLSFHHTEFAQSVHIIQKCLLDIKKWMSENFLMLNQEKTEVLLVGSPYFLKTLSSVSIPFSDITIKSTDQVKNLGCILDSRVKMDKFVSLKCQSAMFYIKSIASIRRHLDSQSTKTLIQSLVISRLDYANSILAGVTNSQLRRLQLVQNAAARLVTNTKVNEHITPVRMKLHWLPIEARIIFKILIHCHNCLNGKAPPYLCQIIAKDCRPRTLRSSKGTLLKVPKYKNCYGSKGFGVFGPSQWNNLPVNLRCIDSIDVFKKDLKTYLFRKFYHIT